MPSRAHPGLVVVGSIALDTIRTPLGQGTDLLGGSAVYFALAASLFCPVGIVGVAGTDFPEEYVDLLESKGIDLSGFQRVPGATFRWGGEYGYDLNERTTLFTHLNVFAGFAPELPAHYVQAPFVFLGNIDPDLQHRVLDQVSEPLLVVGDTMNYWIEGKRESLRRLLPRVDILMINEGEARLLTGEPNLVRAARGLLCDGLKGVVVKKGEHGALLAVPEGYFVAPAFPLEHAVDPTGAGDSFAGGFMGYLASCTSIGPAQVRRAVVYGSAVASFSVEDLGTRRLASLSRDEVERRVRELIALSCVDPPPGEP